jgi:hypothetical protein
VKPPRPPKNPKAAKYRRRAAVLRASRNANKLDAVVPKLLEALAKVGASKQTVQRLKGEWERSTDVTRRRNAVWAIVDELERREDELVRGTEEPGAGR